MSKMNPSGSTGYGSEAVRRSQLPNDAALWTHARSGAYTDCYAVVVPRAVTQAEFVESFYTTWVFKIERWLLARLMSRPSTDAQVHALAMGTLSSFAAWSVEHREAHQLMLAAGRTRSWLMARPSHDSGAASTTLYFGSAVIPRDVNVGGRARMGWQFRSLLGFHKLYSRVLLGAASRRLRLRQ